MVLYCVANLFINCLNDTNNLRFFLTDLPIAYPPRPHVTVTRRVS